MASLDVIALDPTVPQLRAPGVGDTYHFCRVVEFQDGTDAAPSITNVGDTNTGIYWPNADELAVSTGGVQRMSLGATTVFNETGADVDFRIEGDTDANLVFVDASTDRVGLGLNNPDRLLDVDGSSKFRGQILITSGEALGLGLQALQLPTGVESTIGAGLSTRTGVAGESIIQFGNNMNTYYTGSVNAAKAGAMIRIDTRGVEPTPGASAYSVFQIQTRAAGVADPNYTVPVQIGAAPQGTFCIQTNGLATFNYGFVVNEGGGDYDTRFEGDTDTHLFFADASTDRIGIGTNAPGYKLDVNGTANFANNVTFTGGTANGVLYLNASKVATSGSALTFDGTNFIIGGGGGLSRFNVSNNGAGGFEVNPDGTASGPALIAYNRGSSAFLQMTCNALTHVWQNSSSEQMRLTSTGLGIGTSSPAYPLQVRRAGGAGSLGVSIDSVGATDRVVQYFSIQDDAAGVGAGHAFYYRAPSSTTNTLGVLLDESGNLGIGTSSPGTYGKLAIVSTGTSTTTALVNGSTANASNTVSTDYWSGNSFGGLEKIATIGAINPNAGANNGGALYFSTSSNGTATTPTERMRLDSSGNLGLGVTPSAWSAFKAVQVGSGSLASTPTGQNLSIAANAYFDGTNWKYVDSAVASEYRQNGGTHFWSLAPSGTAGNTISFTQAMTLDASGNLGVGVTNPAAYGKTASVAATGSTALFAGSSTQGVYISNSTGTDVVYNASGNSNGSHVWQTGNTERARITSGGNLLLGTTTVAYSGTLLNIGSTSDSQNGVQIQTSTTGVGYLLFGDGSGADAYRGEINYSHTSDAMIFKTAATERARITSGGDLLVGTTGSVVSAISRLRVAATNAAAVDATTTAAADAVVDEWNSATSGDNVFERYWTEAAPTNRGSIDYNRAGGLVRYNTTSDYRAKDIIGPVQNVGETIDALKVYEGVMKGATQSRPMLVAHEAQEYAPYAVSGVKDEMNEDGTPKYQQMDVSALVPLLLAEVQSLRKRVAELETK